MKNRNEPLVSIITPLYNGEKFVKETIKSVINQNYKNWEMIITDDNSTDKGTEIVEKYSSLDSRIKLIKLKENGGAAVSRNISIKEAKGKYIAFLDSDDIWLPKKLEKQIKFMEENGYDFTFTKYQQMSEEGKLLERYIEVPKEINYRKALLFNPVGCLTAIYNQEKLGKIFMPLIRKGQDYGLWLKILKQTSGYGFNENLAHYRLRKESLSANKIKNLKWHWILCREIEKMNVLSAIFYQITCILAKIFKIK
ncbi:MAG: glycosyltransferase family 2 protein [Fusobacteriaceae bacterium]